jgi:uncharacterized protein (DUF2336 family)
MAAQFGIAAPAGASSGPVPVFVLRICMGVGVRDRFRDLEGPQAVRKKDVVLMATVTSFESLAHPSKSELRQFAELFTPLFLASSDEAKRQAVAALSQCPHVPPAVALFIGCQPIGIAAPFLASSQVIDDETLITIARTQGAAHAKAIVRREQLSPKVIDALVGLHQAEPGRGSASSEAAAVWPDAVVPAAESGTPAPVAAGSERLAREEALRQEIKQIARHLSHDEGDRLGLRSLSDVQRALLVRFAREGEAGQFATTLADALSASRWLAERIMLDISGQQLAVTLTSLGMDFADAVFVLERFYPHLTETQGSISRAWRILDDIDPYESDARVEAWRRADSYTYLPPEEPAAAAARPAEPRFLRQIPPARDMRTIARAFGRSR